MSSFVGKQSDDLIKRIGIPNKSKSTYSLSLFDIPKDTLFCYESKDSCNILKDAAAADLSDPDTRKGLTCRTCGLVFEHRDQQLEHFKTKLHLINLKRKMKGLGALALQPFLAEGSSNEELEEECGTDKDLNDVADDTDSSEESEPENDISEYIPEDNAQENSNLSASDFCNNFGTVKRIYTKHNGPQFIFHEIDSIWEFRINICIFQNIKSSSFDPWQSLSLITKQCHNNNIWCVLMLSSGRFAGTIFEANNTIVHKTFRRYTIRAKSGGGQSSHDNKGHKAKSAGATLRRYGEQALQDDVRTLLKHWRDYINSCDIIILAIPRTMRTVIFDNGSNDITATIPLSKDDSRIRDVPFMVTKPTYEETINIHKKCSTILFYNANKNNTVDVDVDVDVESSGQLKYTPSKQGLLQSITECNFENDNNIDNNDDNNNASVLLSKSLKLKLKLESNTHMDDMLFTQHPLSVALVSACERGNEEDVVSILNEIHTSSTGSNITTTTSKLATSTSTSTSLILHTPDSLETLRTPLHIASEGNYSNIVKLLLEAGADPTRRDIRSRTPYFLATSKETRDTFRKYRSIHEMEFDWDCAGVGTALTDELEKIQKDKEKEKKKRAKIKRKEQKEKDIIQVEEARINAEKIKIEEEKRTLLLGSCAFCSSSLVGKKVLELFDRRVCSSDCVMKFRRKLAAEAAEKRL
eukprot:gene12718-26790_t